MLGSKTIFYFDHILTLVLHKYLKKIDLRIFKTYRLILILFTFADFFFLVQIVTYVYVWTCIVYFLALSMYPTYLIFLTYG